MSPIKKLSFLLALMLLAGNQTLWAAEAEGPILKFSRGIENIVTSPLEYLNNYDILRQSGKSYAATAVAGTIYGTFWTACRIVGGAFETVTFLLPIPDKYAPLMTPPTPLDSMRAQ